MDCSEAKKLVLPFVEHKISNDKTGDFIKHVRSCPSCYDELETYFTIYSALEYMDSGARTGFEVRKLLAEEMKQREEQSKKGRTLTVSNAILAVFIVLAVFVLIILFTDFGPEINLFTIIRELFGGEL